MSGAVAVAALLASFKNIDDGSDWKYRFLLHALAIHVGEAGHDPQKQDFLDSCLAELGGDLPATWLNGQACITTGLESDVAPRPGGDGVLTATDWTQMGRFVVKLDDPAPGSEFQRGGGG